uniref:17S U2 SnRNP complex component HTATSF1 n=1 Tax=Culex pipiens TaxID=7175 RepID=A0A8D8AW43_CULPI
MSDESANIPPGSAGAPDDDGAGQPAEPSSKPEEAPADAPAPTSCRTAEQQARDTLLTDSENTNNENRVIEMESNAGLPAVAEEATVEEPAEVVPEVESKSEEGGERDKYAEHVTYNEQGEAIYTDPETKFQYQWCKVKNEWVPAAAASAASGADPYENEHYRWCHETSKWIPKENPKETEHYRWCEESEKWIPKEKQESEDERKYSYVDGVHHYTDKDGAIYFWDGEKKAWFPKIDDEFMAIYQLSYGFTDNTSSSADKKQPEERPPTPPKVEEQEEEPSLEDQAGGRQGKKRKAPPEPPKWFELKPEHNTKVYVSNMPPDVTDEEFAELMAKCGMVLKDPRTNKLKLKLYRDASGQVKGDGLCHYIKIESVDLALELLDNYDVRGHKIRVQRAEFQLKGEYNPSLKPKIKKKEKEKMKKMQEALFDWRPEKMRGERSKHERIVIVKNLFEPELFDREVHLLLEYQNDLREECNKCGTCRRVLVFDRHPEGVAQVTMSDPEEADLVVKLLHGRFFGKRKLTAEIWDGRTKYRVAETEADVNKRLDNWEKYLEQKEEAEEAAAAAAASAATTSKPPKAADQEELPAPTPATTVSDEKELAAEIEPKSAADDSAEEHQPEEEPAAAMDQEEEKGDAN